MTLTTEQIEAIAKREIDTTTKRRIAEKQISYIQPFVALLPEERDALCAEVLALRKVVEAAYTAAASEFYSGYSNDALLDALDAYTHTIKDTANAV